MFFCVANFGLPTLAYGLAGLGMAGHEEVIQVRLIKKIEEERYKKKFFLYYNKNVGLVCWKDCFWLQVWSLDVCFAFVDLD